MRDPVARMERSAIRGIVSGAGSLPGFRYASVALTALTKSIGCACRPGMTAELPHHTFPMPARLALGIERPEDPRHLADEIVHRDETHRSHHAAVGRVVAVVAEHEEMARRHRVDIGVVVIAVVDAVVGHVARAVRQRLAPALDFRAGLDPAGGAAGHLLQSDARHRLVVEDELPLPHLDAVAGQPDHALDVVDRRVLRRHETRRRRHSRARRRRSGPRSRTARRETNSGHSHRRILRRRRSRRPPASASSSRTGC